MLKDFLDGVIDNLAGLTSVLQNLQDFTKLHVLG